MAGADALFTLSGKTAVVTGMSAGIGARLARMLVLAGARVAAISRRATVLDDEATATGLLLSISADLAEHDQTNAAADECLAAFDARVDILINNTAFMAAGVKAEYESYDEIRRTLAVNVEAPILLAQKFFPAMTEAGSGSIINITSIGVRSESADFRRPRTPQPRAGWMRWPASGRHCGVATTSESTAWQRDSSRPRSSQT